MKRNKGKILWGIALILAGLVLAGKYLLGWDITLMFDGWWTLFIIIPALISIIDNGFRVSNVFCLFLGALLLLACQESLSTIFTWKLVIPLVLVFIGISIIVSAVSNRTVKLDGPGRGYDNGEPVEEEAFDSSRENISVSFGRRTYSSESQFKGCSISCSFGNVRLDLRKAIIYHDCVINCHNSFGQTEIMLPPNMNVNVMISPTAGNVDNYYKNNIPNPEFPTVTFQGDCSFGEIVIK